jgi:hypothetical protein
MNRHPEPTNQEVLAGLNRTRDLPQRREWLCVLRATAREHRNVVTMLDATPAWSGVDFI